MLRAKLNENFGMADIFRLKSLRSIDGYRKCQRRRLTRRLGAKTEETRQRGRVSQSLPPSRSGGDREIINARECCEGRESDIYFIISSFRIAVIVRGSAYWQKCSIGNAQPLVPDIYAVALPLRWVRGEWVISLARARVCVSCVCARVRRCERLTPHDRSNRGGWATMNNHRSGWSTHYYPSGSDIYRSYATVYGCAHTRTHAYMSLSLALSRWLMRKLRVSPFRDEAEHAVGKYRNPDRRSDSEARRALAVSRKDIGSGRLSVRRFCGTTRWESICGMFHTRIIIRV